MSWINWAAFLEETSELPPDVTFQVSEKVFSAHKFLLAAASPTLRTQFYGSLPEKQEPIIVEDATPEAFQSLLDFIYSKPGAEYVWPSLSFKQLFDLLKLADYYLIDPLKDMLKEEIATRSKKLTTDTVFEVAEVAEDFKHFDISRDIMKESQAFLINNTSVQDLVEVFRNQNIDPNVFYKVFEAEGEKCPNCKLHPLRCLNGIRVTKENLKIGLNIYPGPGKFHVEPTEGVGIITGKASSEDSFLSKWENDSENEVELSMTEYYFVYKCK